MPESNQAGLRRSLRAARRALGTAQRLAAATAVDTSLARMGLPRPRSRIAAYRAMDGELDPVIVMRRALALGCEVHVPVVTSLRRRRMRFAAWPDEPPRPRADGDAARWFDLVLVPLVGFDDDGNRLGMGAGFYDRHFAFLRHRDAWHRPLLLGLAFEVQRLERLPAKSLDVPLWGVVTERAIHGRAATRIRRKPAETGS
ncbi:MAG: 5-formyltetrahydrofolate cyclo-ligase [Gammaproteobacteria bacterium]|nr:5-formyltetrahydrofolate cyclo-ligase [Gammaproteobacteria bacterium]